MVTTYDEGELLADCIESIRSQTESRFQCVIVDDHGPSDSAGAIAGRYRGDERFEFVRNEVNRGLAGSRNVGLEMAQAPLVTFLDADDFLFPESLEARLTAIHDADDNGTLGGSFCNWTFVGEDEKPGKPPTNPGRKNVTWLDCVDDNVFIASAPMVSVAAARLVGGFDASFSTAEDYNFWARFLRHGYALRATSYVGVGYRQSRSSMFRTTAMTHVENQISIYTWNYQRWAPPPGSSVAPWHFTDKPGVYRLALNRVRRMTVGVVNSLHSKEDATCARLLEDLKAEVEPWMWWATNWRTLVRKTAHRLERYESRGLEERTGALASAAMETITPVLKVESASSLWVRELAR